MQSASVTQIWSLDVAVLSVLQASNRDALGGESVTIQGGSLGRVGYSGVGREGQTGCEATEWISDTSARCRVTQGVSGTRQAVVTLAKQTGSMTQAFSVDTSELTTYVFGVVSVTVNTAGTGYINGDATSAIVTCVAPCTGTGAAGTCKVTSCLLYTSPSPRDKRQSRMPSSA